MIQIKIVLTGGTALMSDYNGTNYMGFASALPVNIMTSRFEKKFFPTYSDEIGRAKIANYSIAKIEASLLNNGFSREEVILADPRKLDKAIESDTKAVGITCMDPLGIGYGSGIVNMAMVLLGVSPKGPSYMSKSFMDVINHPKIKKYKPKIIVGGEAAWQFLDFNMQEKLGIDTVVIGEGERAAPELFKKAVEGEDLPKFVHGMPIDAKDIPPIITPSINGEVEITRGCGRGCKFCTPTLLKFRSIPMDTILKETKLNLEYGAKNIGLHSEDFLRYGSKTLIPNEEKVLELFEKVHKLSSKYGGNVGVDFVTAACTMTKPKLAEKIGREYVNIGRKSFIEVGIETGSPRLIKIIMPGKPLPFKAEEYPEVVKNAIGVLNDGGWTVVGTMITKLPEENEDDVIRSIELVEDLKDLDVVLFILPFIPMGQFRGKEVVMLKEILENDLRRELFIKGLDKSMRQLKKDIHIVKKGITKNMFAKFALQFVLNYILRKLEKIEKMDEEKIEKYILKVAH